jgi:oligopeptidase B
VLHSSFVIRHSSFVVALLCAAAVLAVKPPARAADLPRLGVGGSKSGQAASKSATPQPPVAKQIPHIMELHGEHRVDPYHWLRQRTNPAVLALLKAENAYTDAVLKPTQKFQAALYKEMLSHIQETDTTVPYRMDGWLYYSRTEKGKQYPVHCRKRPEPGAKENIILDLNQLARGHKFLALGVAEVSDDGHLLAYSLDYTGFRQYTLFVKDLRTGKLLPDRAEKVGSVTWAATPTQSRGTLFYTVEDEAKRQYRLYRHELGAKPDRDTLVFEEKDEMFDIGVGRTRSKEFLLAASESKTTSEVRYLRADNPAGEWKVIAPREPDHEYDVDHGGDRFYIRSNKGGRNFRLVTAPVAEPSPRNWEVLVPHRPTVMLAGVEVFRNHCVLLEREGGLPHLRVTELATGRTRRVEMPEPVYDAYPAENEEFDSTTLRFTYESLATPRSTFDHDMERGVSSLLKRQEVPGGFNADNFVTERAHATAPDGTKVPISLVMRKGVRRDGSAPLLLDGYGAYGIPNDVGFSSARLALLDRGVIFAIAHIRGGGELGKPWHDAGRMMNKKNTFTDFIACADHLVAEKFTSRDRLVIEGGSAGGLLMGAVLNLRPDLCNAAVLHVPFVDVINTMLDESLPLTVTEFEEWGNPKKKDEYDYLRSYCPYSNLRAAAYPAMLVKTSLDDSQVMYWEPAKYVAKLRTLKTGTNPLLFKVNLAAGHGGSSGRYDHLKEVALDYAFVLGQVRLTK